MIGVSVEQIGSFKHLSTFVDSKLNFNDVVMKARERRFIMKNLHYLKVARLIKTRCYLSFIESVFIYQVSLFYSHLSENLRFDIGQVINVTGAIAHCAFFHL